MRRLDGHPQQFWDMTEWTHGTDASLCNNRWRCCLHKRLIKFTTLGKAGSLHSLWHLAFSHVQVFLAQMLRAGWDYAGQRVEFHTLQTCNCITKVACYHFTQLCVYWLCNFWYIITRSHNPTLREKKRQKSHVSRTNEYANLHLSIQHRFSLEKNNLKRYQCLMCLCFIQTCRLLQSRGDWVL